MSLPCGHVSLKQRLHHVQLCSFFAAGAGKCDRGPLCQFAHDLGELREPTQHFLETHDTRNFNKWTGGAILPNKKSIVDTINWAFWNMEDGCRPPDWVLNLHWQYTRGYGTPYLQDVAGIIAGLHEHHSTSLRSRSRSPEPGEAGRGSIARTAC